MSECELFYAPGEEKNMEQIRLDKLEKIRNETLKKVERAYREASSIVCTYSVVGDQVAAAILASVILDQVQIAEIKEEMKMIPGLGLDPIEGPPVEYV